jgi:hypothetical protein
MEKQTRLTSQSLARSRFYGQLAQAKGLPMIPDQDNSMIFVLRETASDHTELMRHVRAWTKGWVDALEIQNELAISERTLDLRQPVKAEPEPQPQAFRFKRHD